VPRPALSARHSDADEGANVRYCLLEKSVDIFDDPCEMTEELKTYDPEQLGPRHQGPDDGVLRYSR
jgi:hypothetical protein